MASYSVCEKCKEVVEYIPEIKIEGHTTYTEFKCPKCGHVKQSTRSHIHYGNDGKR